MFYVISFYVTLLRMVTLEGVCVLALVLVAAVLMYCTYVSLMMVTR